METKKHISIKIKVDKAYLILFLLLILCNQIQLLAQTIYPDNVQTPLCSSKYGGTKNWGIRLSQRIGAGADYFTPMVGDLDGDKKPEIFMTAADYGGHLFSCFIYEGGNLSNHKLAIETKYNSNISNGYDIHSSALGRIPSYNSPADTIGLIFLYTSKFFSPGFIHSYKYNSINDVISFKTTKIDGGIGISNAAVPALADFNQDGHPEVYLGNAVFDAYTLESIGYDKTKKGAFGTKNGHDNPASISNAADVLSSNKGLELIAGNCIYKVDPSAKPNGVTLIKQVGTSIIEGSTQVVDINGDGLLDVVVSKNNYLYIYCPETEEIFFNGNSTNINGLPAMGDINGDGLPEIIGLKDGSTLIVYKYDKSTKSLNTYSKVTTSDISELTGMTLFDFNQDGIDEIVYRDESNLRIINASLKSHLTGNDTTTYDMATIPILSGTKNEYPVVADIDGDNEAEIIVDGRDPAYPYDMNKGNLFIFKSSTFPWASARPVWNQFNYDVVNVNEDLTIPQYQFNKATAMPNSKRIFNTFLRQASYVNQNGDPYQINIDYKLVKEGKDSSKMECGNEGERKIKLRITNLSESSSPDSINVSFYADKSFSIPIDRQLISTKIKGKDSTTSEITLNTYMDTIYVRINDRNGSFPNSELISECDYTNNTLTLHTSCPDCIENSLAIESPGNKEICEGEYMSFSGKITTANNNLYSSLEYKWQYATSNSANTLWADISDWTNINVNGGPTLYFKKVTKNNEGYYRYSVKATGIYAKKGCTNTSSASFLKVDTAIVSTEKAIICEGDTFTFGGRDLTSSGIYNDTTKSIITGCDSISSLVLTVNPSKHEMIKTTICEGEKYGFNGIDYNVTATATANLKTSEGCDSIVTLSLTMLPKKRESISENICNGEKYNFGDSLYEDAGTYQHTFSSTLTGCDSIVTLNLTVLPKSKGEINANICDGEFFSFDNNKLKHEGDFEMHSPAINGCDSTTILHLKVFPRGESEHIETLPYGHTYNFLGKTLNSSGEYMDTLKTINGCDSVITLRLTVETDPLKELFIPDGFSPNNDGTNDTFEIKGIEAFPMSELIIMNRWGNKLFDSKPASSWDGKNHEGKSLGKDLPVGTYFYILKLGNGYNTKKGYLYLNK